jgi:hypothetical protein
VGEPGQDELIDAETSVGQEFVGHLLRRADDGGPAVDPDRGQAIPEMGADPVLGRPSRLGLRSHHRRADQHGLALPHDARLCYRTICTLVMSRRALMSFGDSASCLPSRELLSPSRPRMCSIPTAAETKKPAKFSQASL